jgi:hypothetical protein
MMTIKERRARMREFDRSGGLETPFFLQSLVCGGILTTAVLTVGIAGVISYSPRQDLLYFIVSCAGIALGLFMLPFLLSGMAGRWRVMRKKMK